MNTRITFDKDHFRIADNCGGFSKDVARRYAFCFGKPDSPEELSQIDIDGSVGVFGIGMKRALFKIGKRFVVESRTTSESWRVEVDVDAWRKTKEWTFPFTETSKSSPKQEPGTSIRVTELYPNVARDFVDGTFESKLNAEIRRKHSDALHRGFTITLREIPVKPEIGQLLRSNTIRPAFKKFKVIPQTGEHVVVRLIAGLGDSYPRDAGWYIYCNGRMVVGADRTSTTGWGEPGMLPLPHPQYARFRGYAFLDSRHASDLPWNTSKTGVDETSPVWRKVKQQMASMAQPIFSFMNRVKEMTEEGSDAQKELDKVAQVTIYNVSHANKFSAKIVGSAPKTHPGNEWIRYQKPGSEVAVVSKALGIVNDPSRVGKKTFEYYLEHVAED